MRIVAFVRCCLKIVQGCVQFVGIGVFTIHHNDDALTLVQELVYTSLCEVTGIRHFAQVCEIIRIGFI